MISRRRILAAGTGMAALLSARGIRASTGKFPTATVKVIVPYPPGGPTDTLARLMTQRLGEKWNSPVVVDYKPGAGTMIGVANVSQAAADGMTVGIVNSAFVINPLLHKSVPYKIRDLAPVTQLVEVPLVLAANASVPYDNLPQLVEYAKRNPSAMNFATPGAGGTSHLAGELLNRVAGIRLTHIAYKGSAPAHTDVVGGQVPLLIDPLLSVLPLARSGRLKIIAVLSPERVKGAGDLPTVAETYPGFDVSTFLGLVAPAATPRSAIEAVANAVAEVLGEPDAQSRIEELGMFVKARGPGNFGKLLDAEANKWESIIREQKISIE